MSPEVKSELELLELPGSERYKALHEKYLERYADDMPDPDPKLGVVTVVPAYRELQNDNFWRLLRSLTTQKATKEAHEVLYVVNNSSTEANKSQSETLHENQMSLAILRGLRKLQQESEITEARVEEYAKTLQLSDWEKQVFAAAAKQRIQIHGIDASSASKALDPFFNARGRARDIGGHIAAERLARAGKSAIGLIDFIDADCYLSPHYYAQLAERKSSTELVRKRLVAYTPDVSELGSEESPYERVQNVISYLRYAPFEGRARYLVAFREHGSRGHGPIVAASPAAFETAEGYPHWPYHSAYENAYIGALRADSRALCNENDEDFQFKDHLQESIPSRKRGANEATVFVSHRIRAGNVDGQLLKESLDKPLQLQNLFNDVMKIDAQLSRDPVYARLRERAFHRENVQRRVYRKRLERLIPAVIASEDAGAIPGLSDRERDYLSANPALVRMVKDIDVITKEIPTFQSVPEDKRVLTFLRRNLPDIFATPSEKESDYDEARQRAAALNGFRTITPRDFTHIPWAINAYRRLKKNKDA